MKKSRSTESQIVAILKDPLTPPSLFFNAGFLRPVNLAWRSIPDKLMDIGRYLFL